MSLDNSDTLELQDRFNYLLEQYSVIAFELVPKLEKFGKIRSELQLLLVELQKRGANTEGSESLKKDVEEKLKSNAESNKPEGSSQSG